MNVVWSKNNCPHCVQAKQLLKTKGVEFEERIIGDGWTKEQLLNEVPDARTVPQIFINGKLIGGFTELKEYLK
jgi:glutaredoxin